MHLQYHDLTIRSALPSDAPQLVRWWNDGTVMAHAGFPNGLGISVERVIEGLGKGRMVMEESGRLIGECCYRDMGGQVAEIGIKICDASMQNKGLGKKILSLFIRALFEEYSYQKIILDTNAKNLRAQHVYEQLGFQKLRVNRNSWQDQLGDWQSSVDYELTKEAFISYLV